MLKKFCRFLLVLVYVKVHKVLHKHKSKLTYADHILVLVYDAIGDLVLSLPAIDKIRKLHPNRSIYILCDDRNQHIAASLEGITAAIPIRLNSSLLSFKSWKALYRLKKVGFYKVYNLIDTPDKSAMAKMLYLNENNFVTLKLRYKSKLQMKLADAFEELAVEVVDRDASHFVYKMLSLVQDDFTGVSYIPCPKSEFFDSSFMNVPYVVVNLQGSQRGNTLAPADQIQLLKAITADHCDIQFIVFSRKKIYCSANTKYIYPSTILDASAIIQKASLVITTDTSIMHIALSHGTRCLVMMNNESWRDAFLPLNEAGLVLRSTTDKISDIDLNVLSQNVMEELAVVH